MAWRQGRSSGLALQRASTRQRAGVLLAAVNCHSSYLVRSFQISCLLGTGGRCSRLHRLETEQLPFAQDTCCSFWIMCTVVLTKYGIQILAAATPAYMNET